jgi:hypothetical protein
MVNKIPHPDQHQRNYVFLTQKTDTKGSQKEDPECSSRLKTLTIPFCASVLRIRIHMFLGLPDPDPLVRGMDPDPSIIMQK